MLYRVGEACKAEYLRILGRIRTTVYVYVDETGMRVEAQRCWSHLLREVDDFIDKPGGRELSGIVHRKFNRLKLFLD